ASATRRSRRWLAACWRHPPVAVHNGRMETGRALTTAAVGLSLIALTLSVPRVAAAAPAAPPFMTFTPDVRADGVEGTGFGQNEPVTAVDQTGLTYITWQGGNNDGTNTVS